jgi:para-nitrobenzyl esterase
MLREYKVAEAIVMSWVRAFGLGVAALSPATALAQVSERVHIDTGIVEGSTDSKVVSWKGIPFAAPPVGPLGWRAPQPARSWTAVRLAKVYANDCMQVPFPSDAAPLGTQPSEDSTELRPSLAR